MQPDFWHDRWRTGQIGFHQSSVDTNLRQCWQALALPKSSRVLVPLCGKSLDLLWLRDQGCSVIGVELSDIALQAFCMENGVPARRRVLSEFDLYAAPNLELYRGDFFSVDLPMLGNVAAVYDRAALISWAPALRVPYVEHLAALTQPGTETLLVTLEYPQVQMAGPPFSIDGEDVQRLYSPHHVIRELARRDVLANEPRMRGRGVTRVAEVCYRITRL
jgi:thiopurine S-methyltransferase